MSWTHIQSAVSPDNSGGSSGTTLALTLAAPISATRNCLSGMVEFENDIPATLVSVKTDKGDTATIVDFQQDSPNGEAGQSFYFPSLTAGAQTVTATFSASTSFFRMMLEEDDPGAGNSFALDGHASNFQTGLSIGSNAITSTAATTTANGDLIKGFVGNTGGNPAYGVGTSPNTFTNRTVADGNGVTICVFSEDFVQSTAGSIAATFAFTANGFGSGGAMSFMLAFKITASGGTTVNLTGAGVSSAAGSFAGTIAKAIAGVGMTAAAGAIGKTGTLIGIGISSAAGSLAIAETKALPGAGATSGAGTISTGNNASVSLTGAGVSSAAGAFAKIIADALAGAGMTSAAAGVNETVLILASGGTGITSAAGAFSVSAGSSTNVNLSGAGATAAAGALAIAIADALAGAGIAVSAGSLAKALALVLNGASSSAAAGAFSKADAEVLPGAAATAAAGSLAGAIAEALAGASISGSAGSFAETDGLVLPGTGSSAAAGTFGDAIAKALSGASVSAAAGTISPSTSSGGNVSLIGAGASSGVGSFTDAVASVLPGASASSAAGTISAFNGLVLALAGVAVNSNPGNFARTDAAQLPGASTTISAGGLALQSSIFLPGVGGQVNAGSFGKGVTVAPSGAAIAALAGFISPSTSQINLFGAFALASAGIIAVSTVAALPIIRTPVSGRQSGPIQVSGRQASFRVVGRPAPSNKP